MRSQLRYAVAELVLTAALLFLVVTAVRWLLAPDSPALAAVPDPTLRLTGVALAVGAAIALVMSPAAGRFTAGHLNPAVTVGLWALRELPGRSVLPFVAAQLAGSALGMGLGRAAWGPMADTAAVAPGAAWGSATVLVLEAVAMAAMMLLSAYALIAPRLARALPPLMGASVAGAIVGLGPVTGGAVNPARQFGPALWSGHTAHLAAYLVAPVLGALLAAAVFRAVRPHVRPDVRPDVRPHVRPHVRAGAGKRAVHERAAGGTRISPPNTPAPPVPHNPTTPYESPHRENSRPVGNCPE